MWMKWFCFSLFVLQVIYNWYQVVFSDDRYERVGFAVGGVLVPSAAAYFIYVGWN